MLLMLSKISAYQVKVGSAALALALLLLLRRWQRRGGRAAAYQARYWEVVRQRVLGIACAVGAGALRRLGVGVAAAEALRRASARYMASALGIPPPTRPWGVRQVDLSIDVGDKVVTGATLYSPRGARRSASRRSRDDDLAELEPLPVILVRTPYSRKNLKSWGALYAERGYHFVAQDTRGRFSSTGEFFPMLAEAHDGAATIAWIAEQPWCDGNVAITGVSYLGMSALAAVRDGPHPALKAVVPVLAATDLYNVIYGRTEQTRGAPFLGLIYRWSYLVIHLMSTPWGQITSIFTFFLREGSVLRSAYRHTPIVDVDRLHLVPRTKDSGGLPWFQDGLRNPKGDEPYWKDIRKCVDLDALVAAHDAWEEANGNQRSHANADANPHTLPPTLLIGGWYDFFCPEQTHDFRNLQRVSPESRLIVGPWTHWHVLAMAPKMHRSMLRFFDRHLRAGQPQPSSSGAGTAAATATAATATAVTATAVTATAVTTVTATAATSTTAPLPLVDVFAYGMCKWQTQYRQWPPAQARHVDFSLVEGGTLARRFDGTPRVDDGTPEDLAAAGDCAVASYIYDPRDPTPQIGGLTFNPASCGRHDQCAIEARSDVLVFTTAPLSRALTVAGAAKATLVVRSDAEATDFVVRLCHVRAGSRRSENIAEGIRRVHHFEGEEKIAGCERGHARCFYRLEVFLSPILNRIDAGDSLRVQVTSCAYPTRGRHLNTAHAPFHLALEEHACAARQELRVHATGGGVCGVEVGISRVSVPVIAD